MADRETVIKGLRELHGSKETMKLISDTISLLKEQEAEWVYGEDKTGVDGWRCSECNFFEPWYYDFGENIDFIKRYKHCPKCGRRMISYTGKQEGR